MDKSAYISKCKKYRYWLYRSWDKNKKICAFIMLNPSTADGKVDDPTIRKCIMYAERLGYGSLYVVNLFAFRATNKKEIMKVDNPVGPENDKNILEIAKKSNIIIAAWGEYGKYLDRSSVVLNELYRKGYKVFCLKLTKCNEPYHPLYLKKDLSLISLNPK